MRFALLLLLVSASASAQPADSVAASRRPVWLTVSPQFSYLLRDGGDAGWDLLGASVRYHRTVGPVVVQAGLSGGSAFFGRGDVASVHVAIGQSVSVGPLFLFAAAGPSIGRVDSPASGRTVVVPGATASVQATLVVFPAFGIGAEVFAHVNAVDPTAGFGLVYAFGRLPGALIPNPPPTPRRPGP